MMIREVPLPRPLSVIFSPSHITNKVPAVNTIGVVSQKYALNDARIAPAPGSSDT